LNEVFDKHDLGHDQRLKYGELMVMLE
jgi:hypothetical protein